MSDHGGTNESEPFYYTKEGGHIKASSFTIQLGEEEVTGPPTTGGHIKPNRFTIQKKRGHIKTISFTIQLGGREVTGPPTTG